MLLENFQKFILILLYGSLILLSYIALANPMRVNKKANQFFGFFLLYWSIYWIVNILEICGIYISDFLRFIFLYAQIFTPIFLYYSVVFYANPSYKFQKKDAICLIIPLIYFVLLIFSKKNQNLYTLINFISIFHNLPYITIVYFKIVFFQKKLKTFSSNTENIDLKWLKRMSLLLFYTIIITVCYELFNFFVYKMHQHLVMDFLFLIIVYNSAYHILQQKEIYPIDKNERGVLLSLELESETIKENKKQLIPDDEFEELKQKLSLLMDNDMPYLNGELNLLKLSDLLEITSHELSYLINNGFNENFFQFVNKYRVEYAKKILKNPTRKKDSMLSIAFESGFNSKTSFNTIFKKITNLTPTEFRNKFSDL